MRRSSRSARRCAGELASRSFTPAAARQAPRSARLEDKALYHASAVLVSNFSVTLMKLATDLWLRFGWERPAALRALLPLLRGTVSNIAALGLPAALPGPGARGAGG